MEQFSEILRKERTKRGLTQSQLSDHLGLNAKQTISDYENEKSQPNIEMLIKIADFFNITVDHLLGVSPYRNYEEQKIADVSEQKETLCPYSQSASIEIYRQLVECLSKFEKYYYQNDLKNNREPHIHPGVGHHLFGELQARINVYSAVAEYLSSGTKLSDIINKYSEMTKDTDRTCDLLHDLSKWFGA
ncbi:MAG TPA: helix-turn-helix transcriptional regulator [Clostridia bacterium]|nr:helix-turn-helix transcriptional regulator [Clostridia bacterium]